MFSSVEEFKTWLSHRLSGLLCFFSCFLCRHGYYSLYLFESSLGIISVLILAICAFGLFLLCFQLLYALDPIIRVKR